MEVDMKKLPLPRIALLLVGVLFAQESRAQDYTRWGLPEGVLARLGKGRLTGGALAYSPDGTRLAVANKIGIWLYDAHTGTEVALLASHTAIRSVSFSPDGTTLASGSKDGTVLLWDMSPYVTLITTVESASPSLPAQTALLANYPNPRHSLTWQTPSDNGSELTGYEYRYSRDGTPADMGVDASLALLTPITIMGKFLPRQSQYKAHVDTARAVGRLTETPDTLSRKSGRLHNLGIGKRIALKLGTGTLVGSTSLYTMKKILHSLGFKFFCDLYPYFFCGELISLMTGTVVGVTLVDPHDNPFWSSVGSALGIAIGLRLAEKTDTIWPLYVGSSGGSTLLSELSRGRLNTPRFNVGLVPDFRGYLPWIVALRF